MRRIVAVVALVLVVTSGCSSSSTSFEKRGEVCYRTREHHVFGIRTGKNTVQALDANCG